MRTREPHDARSTLAEDIRHACIEAALLAYEDAGILGLCEAGRWEHAVAAMRQLDVSAFIADSEPGTGADRSRRE